MKILYKAFLIFLFTLLLSCSGDNFLNITNENELSSANFYANVDDFDMSLNAVYSAVKSLDLFGQNFYVETLLALPNESDYWNAQSRKQVNASDGNVHIAWRGWYRVVARANDIIENAPRYIEQHNPSTANQERLDQILGQAHFLRGFAYFHLVRLWGEDSYARDSSRLAVPLILKVPATRDEMMVPRATVAQVYDQILEDFEFAESVLANTWDSNNIARVNRYATIGFLGKVHLYMGEDQIAAGYFEDLILNPDYDLVPFDQYDDLFHGKNQFSEESVFELNYTIDMQQNIWENGLGSGIALSLAPPGRGWSNVTPHGVNIFRFGDDPRLEIATFHPDDLVATTSGEMAPAGVSEFNYTGHSFRKYVPEDYSVYSTNRNSGNNYLIMRMADVYLMYAEALNNIGNDPVALEYMNKVRRRAFGHDPEIPQPGVDHEGLSGTALRDVIREERFLELFAEGHRWYDIVRWGIVEEEVMKYNDFRVTQGPVVFNERDYYYPIPQHEVDHNENMTPSTGY